MPALTSHEARLAADIEASLAPEAPEEWALAEEYFRCLEALGRAVSRCPSLREPGRYRGIRRNGRDEAETLCFFASSSHLLHIPAGVTAFRAYLAAKYQAFSFLRLLVHNHDEFRLPLRNVLLSVITALMTEEVYAACLEDPHLPLEAKTRFADDLTALWESGTDPRSVRSVPALEELWNARDAAPPSFGTMEGNSELVRITIDSGGDWQSFVAGQISREETRWALEEFLFGLSYEDIQSIREQLRNAGVTAVDHQGVHSLLGRPAAYGHVDGSDLSSLYDFYVDRRDRAALRRRSSAPGPRRPLEEIYLKYLITGLKNDER